MPRRPANPTERREQILAAALECFVTRGFYGTAVPRVAKAAGMAAGTMYHYFPSKEALVNALYQKWKEAVAMRVFSKFQPASPVREQFRAMWNQMAEFALENNDAFAFLELHHHGSYLDDASVAMENRLKDFGALIVSQAQTQGVIRQGSTTLLMELVFGAFIGMMRAHYEGRIALTDDLRDLAEQACWDAIAQPT